MKRRNFMHIFLLFAILCLTAGMALTASAEGGRFDSTTSRNEDNNICLDFQEFRVVLPADWSGRCQMSVNDDHVSFYQKASRQLHTEKLGFANGGWLFSIGYSEGLEYQELPNYQTLGRGSEGGVYYAYFPTDLQAFTEDEDAYNEYWEMYDDLDWITSNVVISGQSVTVTASDGEYIFPQSSTAYLSESDLAGMSDDDVQMAINEIYARHHRKFVLKEVQEYFNSKSWYTGTIEADDFDVSVMNQYEDANINLMLEYMDK